jgi:hypothetical protein
MACCATSGPTRGGGVRADGEGARVGWSLSGLGAALRLHTPPYCEVEVPAGSSRAPPLWGRPSAAIMGRQILYSRPHPHAPLFFLLTAVVPFLAADGEQCVEHGRLECGFLLASAGSM